MIALAASREIRRIVSRVYTTSHDWWARTTKAPAEAEASAVSLGREEMVASGTSRTTSRPDVGDALTETVSLGPTCLHASATALGLQRTDLPLGLTDLVLDGSGSVLRPTGSDLTSRTATADVDHALGLGDGAGDGLQRPTTTSTLIGEVGGVELTEVPVLTGRKHGDTSASGVDARSGEGVTNGLAVGDSGGADRLEATGASTVDSDGSGAAWLVPHLGASFRGEY